MTPPDLFLIDGIGPFFRATKSARVNWSKIPFSDLPEDENFWGRVTEDFRTFVDKVAALGYTAVTLDDLAHLTPHPAQDDETNRRLEFLADRFEPLFQILEERGLEAWITSDLISLTPAAEEKLGDSHAARNSYYFDLIERFFTRFPGVAGIIMRIGESDGLDVRDSLRSHLHLRTSRQTNRFFRKLLPHTDELGKKVILRTWTVGAHHIGDLIWHRGRLSKTLRGLDSPNFIVSMKPGESDFFRHLPLNAAFFNYKGPKILELQARREYEGGGEFPSYIGFDLQEVHDELAHAENLVGVSVWAQTGGWHRFKRLTLLDDNTLWAELNVRAAIDVFQHQLTPEQSLAKLTGREDSGAAAEFLHHADYVITHLYYIPEFARLKLFFRRIRIPPLLHVYWDSLFIYSPLRKILRYFVQDHEAAIMQADGAMQRFPRMLELADELGWPRDDIAFMRDTCQLIALAREYYFSPYDPALVGEIRKAKKAYKQAWPLSERPRYRIKTDFKPSKLRRRTIALASRVALRESRGYRTFLDHVFTLNLLSLLYRLFRNRSRKSFPKFVRKSAMGIDSVFE